MVKLTKSYALGLAEYAESLGMLESFYKQAKRLLAGDTRSIDDKLLAYLALLPRRAMRGVLSRFTRVADERLHYMDVKIYSAYRLDETEIRKLERKLAGLFRKKPQITVYVDESLLAGLRIIAGNMLLDDTISQSMDDLKHLLYEEVLL